MVVLLVRPALHEEESIRVAQAAATGGAGVPVPDRGKMRIVRTPSGRRTHPPEGTAPDRRATEDSERELLETAARSALAEGAAVTRECRQDPEAWRSLWRTASALDWPGLLVPLSLGGSGASIHALLVVLEEVGAGLAPLPLLSTAGQAVPHLMAAGTAVADQVIADVTAEGADAAVCTVAPMTLLDHPSPDGVVCCPSVPDAPRADWLLLLVDGAVLPVRAGSPGVHIGPDAGSDPSAPAALVQVARSALQPHPPVDPAVLRLAAAMARTATAAELLGVARAAGCAAVSHATQRRQFGQAIGAFQSVKHALADAFVRLARARALMDLAADALDRTAGSGACRDRNGASPYRAAGADDEAVGLSLLAAAAASETAVAAARLNIRLHGAMGLTDEHDAHLALRRARALARRVGPTGPAYGAAAALIREVAP